MLLIGATVSVHECLPPLLLVLEDRHVLVSVDSNVYSERDRTQSFRRGFRVARSSALQV
mgnify:CR=1 FL=1